MLYAEINGKLTASFSFTFLLCWSFSSSLIVLGQAPKVREKKNGLLTEVQAFEDLGRERMTIGFPYKEICRGRVRDLNSYELKIPPIHVKCPSNVYCKC